MAIYDGELKHYKTCKKLRSECGICQEVESELGELGE